MNTIVIYKTRTGFTKQYALWISEELKCEACDYKDINKLDLNSYDVIIYGGRVHASAIDNLKNMIKLAENKNFQLVVYATGATPIKATEQIEEINNYNFKDNTIPHFYMQSGLCYEKMGMIDKAIMKALAKMLSKKDNKSDVEDGTAIAISKSHDISSKEYIKPLIDYVKNITIENSTKIS